MKKSDGKAFQVLIVRDREAAGGGIFHYYQAVGRHLKVSHALVDVGRSHGYYSSDESARRRNLPTPLRVMVDWARLAIKLLGLPDLVVLNPCLDPIENRSLPRDAVNLVLAKLLRRKVVCFWRGWDNEVCGSPEFPGGNRSLLCRVYQQAEAHIVLASDFREDLRRWGFTTPIHLETTVVADEVLGSRSFDDGIETDPGGRFRILYLSRVEVAKGVFEMVDAFALLESVDPGRYHLTIAGDGPALEDLKSRVRELGLNGVGFTGYVNGTVKADCYADADAFCFLSYTEGMPNAVLEAMAAGLPLVSSAAGGLKDILEEGESGFLVEYQKGGALRQRFSIEQVADRIRQLAASPETRARMRVHNREFAQQRFAASKVAGRLEAIWGTLVP